MIDLKTGAGIVDLLAANRFWIDQWDSVEPSIVIFIHLFQVYEVEEDEN